MVSPLESFLQLHVILDKLPNANVKRRIYGSTRPPWPFVGLFSSRSVVTLSSERSARPNSVGSFTVPLPQQTLAPTPTVHHHNHPSTHSAHIQRNSSTMPAPPPDGAKLERVDSYQVRHTTSASCHTPPADLSPLTALFVVPIRPCRPSHAEPARHPPEIQGSLPVEELLYPGLRRHTC